MNIDREKVNKSFQDFIADHDKQIRDEVIEEFMIKAMTKFYNFDVEHGYPTHEDVKDILFDVANEMKGEQNE